MPSPIAQKIANLLARGAVTLVDASKKLQTLQVSLLDNEAKDTVDHLEPYGFTSNPPVGSEVVVMFLEGDRSHGVAIAASNRLYRVQNLQPGDVAIYDARGAMIKFTATGIQIIGGSHPINISGASSVTVTGGDVIADGIGLKTHHHQEHDGPNTGAALA